MGILTETRTFAEEPQNSELTTWPALQARRRRWAELLQRIFEVEILRCPRCGARTRSRHERCVEKKSCGTEERIEAA